MPTRRSDVHKNLRVSSYLILGMIRIGVRTGYEIRRRVELSTRFFWAASNGQIYPELRRLEAAGLVHGHDDPTGERQRKVFELTSEGEAALHGWLTDSTTLTFEQRNEGLLKFFFADALSSEEAVELVRAMRHHHELILAGIHQATPPYRPERRFGYLTKEYGLGLHGWIVEWCKETERELASGLAPRELETT